MSIVNTPFIVNKIFELIDYIVKKFDENLWFHINFFETSQ